MLTNHTTYKYETPHKSTFVIKRCFTKGEVNLQCRPTKIRYNIRRSKPYKSDTTVEDFTSIKMSDDVSIWLPVIYFRVKY